MKLSIVIPSYNRYRTTLRLVNSLKTMIRENIEVIVVNDGSTEKYGKFPSFVKYYETKNNGGQIARMNGWIKSTGKYIWFFDSDDEISSTAIDTILSTIGDDDVYVYQLVKENKKRKYKKFPFKTKNNKPWTMGYCSYFQDKVFKSSSITKDMFDSKSEIFQDENFMLRFGKNTKTLKTIKDHPYIAKYLYNFGSVSKNHTTKKQVLKLVNNVVSLIPFIDKLEDSKFKIKARKQMTRMLAIARGWSLKLNREERKEIVSKIRKIKKDHKKVFGFIFNYSTAYHLIAFVNIMGWV